jgi:transcriptional regulator with XRE-family HTH domain
MPDNREYLTPAEWEGKIGDSVRTIRLKKNETRKSLCLRSGVSLSALVRLEEGNGSTLRTLILVIRALDRESWFAALAPAVTVNPLTLVRNRTANRQRARQRKVHEDNLNEKHTKNDGKI